MPAIFLHSDNDALVNISHMAELYDAYAGDKSMLKVTGDHNSYREPYVYKRIQEFILRCHNPIKLRRLPKIITLLTEMN